MSSREPKLTSLPCDTSSASNRFVRIELLQGAPGTGGLQNVEPAPPPDAFDTAASPASRSAR